jgi:hypothetical protein
MSFATLTDESGLTKYRITSATNHSAEVGGLLGAELLFLY